MMVLITFLDVVQDVNCFLDGGRVHQYFLKPAFKGAVLFYMLAVLIKCCGAYALYLTPCQCRFEHVCGIE